MAYDVVPHADRRYTVLRFPSLAKKLCALPRLEPNSVAHANASDVLVAASEVEGVRAACKGQNLTPEQTHSVLKGTVDDFHRKVEQRLGTAAALLAATAKEREGLLRIPPSQDARVEQRDARIVEGWSRLSDHQREQQRNAMLNGTNDEVLFALARSPFRDADGEAALEVWRGRAERQHAAALQSIASREQQAELLQSAVSGLRAAVDDGLRMELEQIRTYA